MKAIRILLSIAMLIAAGLGAFNVIPLRTAYFTLIILVAITVSIRIIHRIAGTGTPNTIVRIISEIIASLCILGFALIERLGNGYIIFLIVSQSSATAVSSFPFLISSTTQVLMWLDKRTLQKPFNADWTADT